ncbi:MAG: HD domain-containing protein [Methanohalobium sp.]|uniref:HD domain-containing protein n=1 Tax=Methanohalobium sp. TaxID=2837493 RepID=UPI00397E685E
MKVIRDPVHGYIELDELALSLIDTPLMQRLRRIKQLGLSSLVYPGANHTRFEHSLGVMHLASMLMNQLNNISIDEKNELRAAALLHDIGHGPYSHVTEGTIKYYTRKKHDDVREVLKRDEIADILHEHNLDPETVAKHIKGETALGQILNSEIDVDRMDYLVRDAHYTGVTFGLVDYERLIHEMEIFGKKLVVRWGGLKAAESLLLSRFLMYPSVYYHHVSRIAETMYIRAIQNLIDREILSPFGLNKLDDISLFEVIRSDDDYAGELGRRIEERKLFKRALRVGFQSLGVDVLKYRDNVERIEIELAEMADIDSKYILIDIPGTPEIEEMKALIRTDSKMQHLDDVSQVVATLEQAHRDNWRMGVYTPKEYRDIVGKVARDFFEVKKPPKQYRLTEY